MGVSLGLWNELHLLIYRNPHAKFDVSSFIIAETCACTQKLVGRIDGSIKLASDPEQEYITFLCLLHPFAQKVSIPIFDYYQWSKVITYGTATAKKTWQ